MFRLVVAIAFLFASDRAGAVERPNVVLILADDLGWADLGCYGSDLHQTPNLDRFAREGVRFTDAYSASPVCTPTRASILTGKHPARLQMTIWREAARVRGSRRLLEPLCLDSLPREHQTLAEILQQAGYDTLHVGKWHLGRAESYPQAHGFDRNVGGTLWGAPETFWFPFAGDQYFGEWRYVPDLEPGQEGDYLTDALTDAALEFMSQQKSSNEPFFLNLWYHAVHTPIEGKPRLVEKYRSKIRPESIQRNPFYAAMVETLDENVGRVLRRIDELGLADQTLVLFGSDNGGFINRCKLHRDLQVANNSPLRSGKGSCYEGGVRVPLIIRGPGVVSGICRTPVTSCDFLPTILSQVGLEAGSGEQLDGADLSDQLVDPSVSLDRDAIYFHYPHYYQTTTPVGAIRRGDWKLLEYFEIGKVELYQLSKDLGEMNDLSEEQSELAGDLLGQLHRWQAAIGAQMPERNPDKP